MSDPQHDIAPEATVTMPSAASRVATLAGPPEIAQVATITVTFNPELRLLEAQLRALPAATPKIVVDNASAPDTVRKLRALLVGVPNATLLCNNENLGLPSAINHGVQYAHGLGTPLRFIWLLDQDSEPSADCLPSLLDAFDTLQQRGERVGCVGPALVDAATGLDHGFHQCTRWRWKRVHPAPTEREPVPVANLNGSGTLIPIALFLELGGLEEDLFIDHVDTEWAFRVQARGYRIFGIPSASMQHRMGDSSQRLWLFGWRVWPVRSPRRHYYLFRNAILLMRRRGVPGVWKVWAAVKLMLTAGVFLLLGPHRIEQISSMSAGVWTGLMKPMEQK